MKTANQLQEEIKNFDFISAIREKQNGNAEQYNKYKNLELQLKEAEKEENKNAIERIFP